MVVCMGRHCSHLQHADTFPFIDYILWFLIATESPDGAGSDQREEHPRKAAKTAKDMPKNMKNPSRNHCGLDGLARKRLRTALKHLQKQPLWPSSIFGQAAQCSCRGDLYGRPVGRKTESL